ncbi:hypothetical protein HYT32_01830 [Candidatus Roizmanbacteria bacterium]|nr:hypothetical protein [Candidatus Roizmanbacteria bacterium]
MAEVGEAAVLEKSKAPQQEDVTPKVSSNATKPPLVESAMATTIVEGGKRNPDVTLEELAGISSSTREQVRSAETHFDKAKFTALCKTVDSTYGRHKLWETKPEKFYKAVKFIGDRRELSDERLRNLMNALRSETDLLQKALHTDEYYAPTLRMMNLLMGSSREKHAHELGEFAATFVQENLPYIETVLSETSDEDKIERSINAVGNMAILGDKPQKELNIDFLLRNFEPVLRKSKDIGLLRDRLQTMFKGSEMQVSAASSLVRKLLRDNDLNIREFISDEISSVVGSGLYYEQIRRVAKDILETYEIDYSNVVKAWADSGKTEDFMDIVNNNLRMIFILESNRPGIVKTLINDYKIYDFARYPAEMLVEQYDQRDNKYLPYGIVLYPRSDWNGAFYDNRKVFRKLLTQLKENGYGLRVFEVESVNDVARSLIKLNKLYGESYKISFAIIGGHGSWDSIHFGSEREHLNIFDIKDRPGAKKVNLLLKQHDLRGRGVQRSSEFFEQNPTIILNSCTTGANRGIAQEISRLGTTVIGPDRPASIKDIKVTGDNRRLNFEVGYRSRHFWEKPEERYSGGQKD